ncbi:MAG: NADH-quinone oxidoreductase subunit L [Thiobacillus sp. SCN 63-374]|uniref:NADH-quinone oxidoreductase subunit L n=1 Tax=Thiobacillus sp. TaxID=924 RepID=UPI0008691EF5|nr:NADH-quinone oxidoreductase subunit L [Thiobacillus sp.]MBN8779871.1 NADH-quinone oxidoreductase subunit L [Thiobacillus sp.]MBS0310535.1 NADH-quinone oxidoreductase subunit L [Pseudomonadota bacterium]ODU49101.1 MAG: NADH-quinone oxidoreductase subunit L [Thiobacillus sp. SCN 63-374]
MRVDMQTLYLVVPLAPLFGAIVAGLFGRLVGRTGAHVVTIAGVAVSFVASVLVFQDVLAGHTFNGTVYTWMTLGDLHFEVGFLVDALTAMMMLVVTFVSLMVHVYTIGYMHDDPGYQRFFSYISLFTFSMLMLVMSNNFLQLFFGWEAVGLVSYLLIGFWYTKETAIYANLKAFLVNRVGDFGFILGIGLVLAHFGSLDYATVFAKAPSLASETITLWPDTPWMLMSVIGILLFIGAMGKSAQFPLHVWLPDSMEGPTPISALIHAATMVTAGIFMVARMSPLYELSDTALSFIMVIGAITALFMGFLGMVQNDIKRVVAYSTLSQLGYMTVALGASAYSVAVFHLMTHAFFKALLFLAAGSVIIAMHHNQDIRYMGGLKKYMPITWVTSLIGSLALIGTPFLSGFYSKESIIEAAKVSHLPGAGFAYFAVLAGVFVTAFYSFRMYFLVFHGKERFHQGHGHGNEPDAHHGHDGPPHETPWVVTGPLLALALPSLAIGYMTIEPMLFGDFFGSAIYVADRHPVMHELNQEFHGAMEMGLHALTTLPFWLAAAGVGLSAFFYLKRPDIPAAIAQRFSFLHRMLLNKYWFDELYSWVFAKGARALGGSLWRRGDQNMIDGFFVNGSAHLVERFSRLVKAFQSGYIYHYAFAMLIGVFALVTWFARLN